MGTEQTRPSSLRESVSTLEALASASLIGGCRPLGILHYSGLARGCASSEK